MVFEGSRLVAVGFSGVVVADVGGGIGDERPAVDGNLSGRVAAEAEASDLECAAIDGQLVGLGAEGADGGAGGADVELLSTAVGKVVIGKRTAARCMRVVGRIEDGAQGGHDAVGVGVDVVCGIRGAGRGEGGHRAGAVLPVVAV